MGEQSLLIHGGKILTMDNNEEIAEAIAIRENRIVYVGSYQKCKSALNGDKTREIDLKGKCLLPGFIDPHAHLMMLGMSYTWADISYPKVKSIDDMIHVLLEHKRNIPKDAVIRGFGFDQRNLRENRYPTASELDRVADDRAVQIMHVSGHCNVINHHYMDQLGIRESDHYEGGAIGKDENGKFNGQLFDSANDAFASKTGVVVGNHGPNIHMPDSSQNLQNLIHVGQEQCLSAGITTINDPQVTKQEMEYFQRAKDNGSLKMRIVMSFLSTYLNEIADLGFRSGFGDEQLALGSIKFYADGSLNSGTAYLSSGYLDSSRKNGYLYHKKDLFQDMFLKAHKQGFQTITHAQGDEAIQLVIDSVRKAQSKYPRQDIRHRIEHCGLPDYEQIQEISELNIWPVPQPQHVYQFGEGVIRAVGKNGENYSPYGWFKSKNIPIVLSSDAPVAPPNPLQAIYAAITRATIQGNVVGGQHKISLIEALKGYTIEAAKAIHCERFLGSIERGKKADFVILENSPFDVPMEDIPEIKLCETWVGGEQVFINKAESN